MKTSFVANNPGCHRLIILFSGWSTSPDFYTGISSEGWDVMVVYDYSDDGVSVRIPDRYSTVLVVAWSLGVTAAEMALRHEAHRVAAAFAVNGTLAPADDIYGIPSGIYHDTEMSLNERNLRRFRHRLSTSRDPYRFPEDSPAAISPAESADHDLTISRLRTELRLLASHSIPASADECVLPWRRTFIGSADLIFPADAQRRAWEAHPLHPQICEWECGHYIPLSLIIDNILPDLTRIRNHFEASHDTYDANATAQIHIATRLADMAGDLIADGDKPRYLLEIGPGTGCLTRRLQRLFSPQHATFIDLCPLAPFNMSPDERYVTADAEQWMAEAEADTFDFIASASTIQWFVDPRGFFRNAARLLKPGGRLICSTFVSGNLAELDALRPAPIIYHSSDEIYRMAAASFGNVSIEEEDIPVVFDSPRQALMHLKLTGVAGTAKSNIRNLLTSLPARPSLTYRALYIRAIKKLNYFFLFKKF